METAATPVLTPPAAVWEDFLDIFYAPASVFRRREQGSVMIPLVVVTILMGALFVVNTGVLQPVFGAEFDRQMAIAMRRNPNIPPEAVERMRTLATRMTQVWTFVFTPLMIVCVGLTTWVAGKLVDAKQSVRSALMVAAYAFVPRVIELFLHGMQGLILDPAHLDGRFRLSFGVGRFIDPDETAPIWLALVGRLDVFTIWVTALLAIGLCVTGRIPLHRAAFAAALVWIAGAVPQVVQALGAM